MTKKNLKIGIMLMIFSSVCTCCGQLMWKLAAIDNQIFVYYLIGFMLYGLGALLMIISFKYGEMSILHPILSMGFILSIFLGASFVGEQITIHSLLGICLIIIGIIFLGISSNEELK